MGRRHQFILALTCLVLAMLACGPLSDFDIFGGAEPTADPAAVVTIVPTVAVGSSSPGDSTASGSYLRQWASGAKASSEYGEDAWSAMQATGAPDTPGCGDIESAWASAEPSGADWIELSYAVPVQPIEVLIFQTHNPDHVVQVEMVTTSSEYVTVYEAEAKDLGEEWCPYNLSIAVNSDYLASGVRITIDQTELSDWCEIDAVELVGYTQE